MGVRVQVVFDGETLEEVLGEVRQWLEASQARGGLVPAADGAQREREIQGALQAMRGEMSRRVVRLLAESGVRGEEMGLAELREALRSLDPAWGGAGLSGIVGGPNKLMRRSKGARDLIVRDRLTRSYRISPGDARVVLATWGPTEGAEPGGAGRSDAGRGAGVAQPERKIWG